MGSAARHKAGGLSLRFERNAARASLRTGPRPITSSNPRSVGCHSPKAVHRGSLVRHKKWRAVAALRGRPTRRQCTMGSAARHKAGGLSLRSERNAARAALRTGPRPITSSNPRSVGCHSPKAVHQGSLVRHKSWRVVAALRSRPTSERNAVRATPTVWPAA